MSTRRPTREPWRADLGEANLHHDARWCSARTPLTRAREDFPMYVCHCSVVTDRDIIESVANGARCVNDVARQTGAGRVCGGCIGTVRELVCQSCPVTAERGQEVASAAR